MIVTGQFIFLVFWAWNLVFGNCMVHVALKVKRKNWWRCHLLKYQAHSQKRGVQDLFIHQ